MTRDELIDAVLALEPGVIVHAHFGPTDENDGRTNNDFEIKEVDGQKVGHA